MIIACNQALAGEATAKTAQEEQKAAAAKAKQQEAEEAAAAAAAKQAASEAAAAEAEAKKDHHEQAAAAAAADEAEADSQRQAHEGAAAAAVERLKEAEALLASAATKLEADEAAAASAKAAAVEAESQRKDHEAAAAAALQRRKEAEAAVAAADAQRSEHESAVAELKAAAEAELQKAQEAQAAAQGAKEEAAAQEKAMSEELARLQEEHEAKVKAEEAQEEELEKTAEEIIYEEGWVPGAFPYRGSHRRKGTIACSCMKNCICKGDSCECVNTDQHAVGPGAFEPADVSQSEQTTRLARRQNLKGEERSRGKCACFCNRVPSSTPAEVLTSWVQALGAGAADEHKSTARRRLLSSASRTPRLALAELASKRAASKSARASSLQENAASGECAEGYEEMIGDIPGWGRIGSMGGGQDVQACEECASKCTLLAACGSYECSPVQKKCKLNMQSEPVNMLNFEDFVFCSKSDAVESNARFPLHATRPPGPPSLEPPPDAKMCTSASRYSAGRGSANTRNCVSRINPACSSWRDSAHLWPQWKQVSKMELCMKQDCEQSLEVPEAGGTSFDPKTITPGCRFVDSQGFCYARDEAQMWCARAGRSSARCNDLGDKAAVPPLGSRGVGLVNGETPMRRLLAEGGVSGGGREGEGGEGKCDCSKCSVPLGTEWMLPANFKLPPLVYSQNHWLKRAKWDGDIHDGEEKPGLEYWHRQPPRVK